MTDWATDWLTVQLGTWPANRMTDWATDLLTVQLGTWLTDRMTDWATDWMTVQLGIWLTDRMTDWATNWITDCAGGYLTDWQNDWLSNWLNNWLNWLTATNWLTDLGTDWGLQNRGQFNKTFTSVIYKCIHCSKSVLITLRTKETSLLHSNELQFSVFSYRGFW